MTLKWFTEKSIKSTELHVQRKPNYSGMKKSMKSCCNEDEVGYPS